MIGIEHYFLFILSGLLLNVTPGTDTLYILGRTLSQGRIAGFASVAGSVAGQVIHTLLSAFGLSFLLMQSATAFAVVKWLGAGYLIYLGVRMWATRSAETPGSRRFVQAGLTKTFLQGMLTNLLNPKVALFFLAFLPQFIRTDNPYGALPFLLLGLTFIATGTAWCLILVVSAERVTGRIRSSRRISAHIDKITGSLFVALGLKLLRTPR